MFEIPSFWNMYAFRPVNYGFNIVTKLSSWNVKHSFQSLKTHWAIWFIVKIELLIIFNTRSLTFNILVFNYTFYNSQKVIYILTQNNNLHCPYCCEECIKGADAWWGSKAVSSFHIPTVYLKTFEIFHTNFF